MYWTNAFDAHLKYINSHIITYFVIIVSILIIIILLTYALITSGRPTVQWVVQLWRHRQGQVEDQKEPQGQVSTDWSKIPENRTPP